MDKLNDEQVQALARAYAVLLTAEREQETKTEQHPLAAGAVAKDQQASAAN